MTAPGWAEPGPWAEGLCQCVGSRQTGQQDAPLLAEPGRDRLGHPPFFGDRIRWQPLEIGGPRGDLAQSHCRRHRPPGPAVPLGSPRGHMASAFLFPPLSRGPRASSSGEDVAGGPAVHNRKPGRITLTHTHARTRTHTHTHTHSRTHTHTRTHSRTHTHTCTHTRTHTHTHTPACCSTGLSPAGLTREKPGGLTESPPHPT